MAYGFNLCLLDLGNHISFVLLIKFKFHIWTEKGINLKFTA